MNKTRRRKAKARRKDRRALVLVMEVYYNGPPVQLHAVKYWDRDTLRTLYAPVQKPPLPNDYIFRAS